MSSLPPTDTAVADVTGGGTTTNTLDAINAAAAAAAAAGNDGTTTATTTTATTATTATQPPIALIPFVKKRKKCGTPKGGKHITHPQSDWYQLCLEYTKLQCEQEIELQCLEEEGDGEDGEGGGSAQPRFKRRKLSQRQFLKQQTIVPMISGDIQSHVMTFSRNLKKFHAGTLENSNQKRSKSRQYEDIEQRLVCFIAAAAENNTACTWEVMQEKCRDWATELGYDSTFKASAGWLHKTLKRHNLLQNSKKGSGESGGDDIIGGDDPVAVVADNRARVAQLPPILPPPHMMSPGSVNYCRNCPQWKQIHTTLTQEKHAANAKIRRLEQQEKVSQKKVFELEKKLKLSQQEVQRLKGVVKAALKID